MKYIVGLGNPGKEYENTRHNIGQDVVEQFVEDNSFSSWYVPSHGEFRQSTGEKGAEEYVCIIPMTFMNKSGSAVAHFIKKESDLHNLIVVHDELDVPEGEVKNTTKRGPGGNRGVESIIQTLGSKEFDRVRIGIAPKDEDGKALKFEYKGIVKKYVLERFESEEVHSRLVELGVRRLDEVLKNK